MVLSEGKRVEELVPEYRLDLFWRMVAWCGSECFGLSDQQISSYRQSLDSLPPEVAVYTYVEHPMSIAADLASETSVPDIYWLRFDEAFETELSALHVSAGSDGSSDEASIATTDRSSQRALEKLRSAEEAIEDFSKSKSQRRSWLDSVIGGVVAVVSARLVIILAELIALLSKLLR